MKITISKSELLGSVKAPARIASRATADFLACLLIDAKDDAVTVSAMDFVESVRVSAPALVDEPGTALISASSLMGIAKALPDAAVELCADESGAVITCGKSKFDIPALDPDLFPSFPEVTPEEELSIPAADFAFLSKVGGSFAAVGDKAREVLCCVHIEVGEGVVRFASTDSYRVVEASAAIDGTPAAFEANIPAAFVSGIVPEGDSVVIGSTSQQIVVTSGSTVYVTRVVAGKFPNYRPIMELSVAARASLAASVIIGAAKRAQSVAGRGDAVELSIRPGGVGVDIAGTRGRMADAVEAETEGECSVFVNLAYLADALANVKGGAVSIQVESPLKPLAVAGDGVRMAVMPVRRS